MVAAPIRTRRDLASELELMPDADGVPTDCVVNSDNQHPLPREDFRRTVTTLSPARSAPACRALAASVDC